MTDLALRLHRDGYRALDLERRDRGHASTYAATLLGRPAVVLGGHDGARAFYDESLVRRAGAIPPPLAWLLFGRGAVHGLDGDEHGRRRGLLAEQLLPSRSAGCAAVLELTLDDVLAAASGSRASVHDLLVRALGRAVLAWAGVPARLMTGRADALARAYARVVDGFGFAGAAYPRAWRARRETDAWARDLIDDVRHGRVLPPSDAPVTALAASDLDVRTAAVELGNLLRPTIAVAWLGTFAVRALAGAADSDWPERLAAADPASGLAFAHEVRRTTPFVPALAGRIRVDARGRAVDGVRLRPGQRVILDVRGIDLDPDVYPEPLAFRPERFLGRLPDAYDLVPQGGGPASGHRCPGESLTLQLLPVVTTAFARTPHRLLDPQSPTDEGRIPTLPPGGLRVVIG